MKMAICGLMLAGITGLSVLGDESKDPQCGSEGAPVAAPQQSIAQGEKKLPLPGDPTVPSTASTNKQSSIIGKAVYDLNGTELGRVQDLVVDMEKGELGYIVLEVKTEDGPRKFPIPAGALKQGQQPDKLVLNISPAVLAAAEVYRDDELPESNAFTVDEAVGAAAASEKGTASSDEKEGQVQQKTTLEQKTTERD